MTTPFTTSRLIPASPGAVFAAFEPERLARWWGPAGFTNTFHRCEVETAGRWEYDMHGPDGATFGNESRFREVTPPTRVVIEHLSNPVYILEIDLAPADDGGGTAVSWCQTFDKPAVARNIARIVVPANEENLDRLTAEVLG